MHIVRGQNNRGSTLIAALISLMIIGFAAKVLMQLHESSTGSIKSTGLRLDLQDVKHKITSRLNCQKTLETFGSAPPINCSGNVILRDRNGQNIISNNGKLANWTITARCENLGGQNGLSIYATKKLNSGDYMKDPLNKNVVLDDSSPISLVFKQDVRPCASLFDPAGVAFKTCPDPNDYIAGVNFETGELKCLPKMPTPSPTDYISQITSSDEACGGTGPSGHIPARATCPSGWLAVSCGYVLTRWGRGSGSNAPDLSHASSPGGCVVIAGGKPGRSTCFKSIATCLNISKVANGS